MRWLALAFALLPTLAWAQPTVRVCFEVAGQPTCQIVGSANPLPTSESAVAPPAGTTGGAVQVRFCYLVANQPTCQQVDASHPLPVN